MATVSLGGAGRSFSSAYSRVAPQLGRVGSTIRNTGGASTDGFAGTYQSSSFQYAHPDDPTDFVQFNTIEGIANDGIYGARVSAFDAQLTLGKNGRVALAASGPNAQAIGGLTLTKDFKRATIGGSLSMGGVQASGVLGDQSNNVRGSVGVGLGIGASVDASIRTNPNLSSTTSVDLGLKALGRFNLGLSMTSSPPNARVQRRGRNPGKGQLPLDMDRARDLAKRAFDLTDTKVTTLSGRPAETLSPTPAAKATPVEAPSAAVAESAEKADKPDVGKADKSGASDSKCSKGASGSQSKSEQASASKGKDSGDCSKGADDSKGSKDSGGSQDSGASKDSEDSGKDK